MLRGLTSLCGIDTEYIGAKLANSGDDVQVAFFKAFVKELKSWDTTWQMEMQLTIVARQLTEDERRILSIFAPIED